MANSVRDIVFFLGAGFSRDVGLPTMADFAEGSGRSQPHLLEHANAPEGDDMYRHAGRRIRDAQLTFERFRRQCVASGLISPADSHNLEVIFCIAEAVHQAGHATIELEGQSYSLQTILRDLQLWIWKTYQQLPAVTLKKDKRTFETKEPYNKLFSVVRKLGIASRLVVLTTNYDIVVEYFSWKNRVPVAYPFSWDPAFAVGHGPDRFVKPLADDVPLLCKLHGSINYFENREADGAEPFVAADVGTGRPIGSPDGPRYQGKPTILAFDAIWHLQKKYGDGFTPTIIPPSYAKLREKRWLTKAWHAALDSLRTARAIIFIGYSLPPSDGFMTALFRGAAVLRGRQQHAAVHLIDCCPAVHERYQSLFGAALCSSEPTGFAMAVDDQIPAILDAANR